MKSFQITVRKILMLLGVLIAFVPCALLLSACGESSIGQSQEKQYL